MLNETNALPLSKATTNKLVHLQSLTYMAAKFDGVLQNNDGAPRGV